MMREKTKWMKICNKYRVWWVTWETWPSTWERKLETKTSNWIELTKRHSPIKNVLQSQINELRKLFQKLKNKTSFFYFFYDQSFLCTFFYFFACFTKIIFIHVTLVLCLFSWNFLLYFFGFLCFLPWKTKSIIFSIRFSNEEMFCRL